jgi:hypothetical protein
LSGCVTTAERGISLRYQPLQDRNGKFSGSHEEETDFARSYVSHSPLFYQLLDFPFDQITLEKAQMIKEENPIQMIHFMRKGSGKQILAFDGDVLAVEVEAFQYDFLRAQHHAEKARNTQATFILKLLAFTDSDFRIDDRNELVAFFAGRTDPLP